MNHKDKGPEAFDTSGPVQLHRPAHITPTRSPAQRIREHVSGFGLVGATVAQKQQARN